jgi:tetratricopeptide (TPR) repeat protein
MSPFNKKFIIFLWLIFFIYLGVNYIPHQNFFSEVKTVIESINLNEIPNQITDTVKPDIWAEAESLNEQGLAIQKTNPALAESLYRQAIEKDPTFYYAYNNLGIVLHDAERMQEAFAVYQKAIAVKPDYAKAYNNLGVWYYDSGDKKKAVEMYLKSIDITQADPNPWGNVAVIFDIENGNTETAIPFYQKALELGSKNTTVLKRAKDLGLISSKKN